MKEYSEIRKELRDIESLYREESKQYPYTGQRLRLEKLSAVAGILCTGLPHGGNSENGSVLVGMSINNIISSLKKRTYARLHASQDGLSEVSVSSYVRTVSDRIGLEFVLTE